MTDQRPDQNPFHGVRIVPRKTRTAGLFTIGLGVLATGLTIAVLILSILALAR